MKSVVIDGVKYVPEVDPLAEVKAAYAAGKTVQFASRNGDAWQDLYCTGSVANFSPNPHYQWRVKPEPKPDVVQHLILKIGACSIPTRTQTIHDNLRLTFDGETGKLKSAEVL